MILGPNTTLSLAMIFKIFQKFLKIQVCSSYSSRFIDEKHDFSQFLAVVAHQIKFQNTLKKYVF